MYKMLNSTDNLSFFLIYLYNSVKIKLANAFKQQGKFVLFISRGEKTTNIK